MSQRALDLLTDLDLFDRQGRLLDLVRFSDSELNSRLESYSRVRAETLPREVAREATAPGQFSAIVSSVSATNAVLPLLPSALVYHKVYADDPLFPLGQPASEFTRASRQSYGFDAETPLDRGQVAKKLEYFAALAPLIRRGILSVLPVSHLHRAPEQLPVFFSEDGFASSVPEHIRDFIRDSAVVREVIVDRETKRMLISPDAPKRPTRGIAIGFRNDHSIGNSMIYLLHKVENVADLGGGKFRMRQWLDWDDPPKRCTTPGYVSQ